MKEIYNALTDEKFVNQLQFHMPGHLRGRGFEEFNISPLIDVTELTETDDLHNPTGVIKKSQDYAAKIFGADRAYYLVNGSSCGVQAMVLGTVGPGEKIIADRFCHKSFVSALTLSGAECVWVYPEIINKGTMWTSVTKDNIEKAILENPDAKAVYLTAPNYFGIMGDIKGISEIVHKHNMLLLIDGAHSAHYGMSEKLPPSLIKLGADAVCVSLHKTLPSLTQSAMLLTKGDMERVEKALKIVQTSSPSYILTASCEYAVSYWENCDRGKWDELYSYVEEYFPQAINCEKDCYKDFSRLNIECEGNPFTVSEVLRKEYNISVECAYGSGVVAILNSFHTKDEIRKLKEAIDNINLPKCEPIRLAPCVCERVYSPREAFFAKKTECNIKEAVGKISAEGIMVYPPGVYQVLPGERISKEAVEAILQLMEKGAEIPSLKKSNCLIFEE